MKFRIIEYLLSTCWYKYYYSVTAETKEEAVKKVENGEVECYDAEQFSECQYDIDPLDNDGKGTREIYDDKGNLMWHNAELVDYGELVTRSIEKTKAFLLEVMSKEPELFSGGDISLSLTKEVMEQLGWSISDEIYTDGWDVDFHTIATKEGKNFDYLVSGNLYYGNLSISKINER